MKRVIFTIFLSLFVLFQTGCDEIAELAGGVTGCMLQDASNYDAGALAPCVTECLGDKTGANCCCEDIVYGCMDPAASNHSELASAPCSELINGVKVENACCISEVSGCTDEAANNYNVLANKDDSSCTYDSVEVTLSDGTTASVTPGCMNADACNYVAVADADCNADNATISGSDWVQNDDCCNLTKNASCYLDLNNNGYYEEVNTSANLCNCRDLGVGWVSEDKVADEIEVQGCTSPTVNGEACVEYNPLANVDNGGCCQQEFSFEDYADFDESSLDFMGVFDVGFMMGMVDQAGECVMDTSMGGMDMEESFMAQLTLGLPNSSGEGQLQYFEVYRDEMESRPEWEVRIPSANTEDKCFAYADSSGSDYSFCANWGHDYENCEDFDMASDCPPDKCIWETKFCFPTFEGQPCPSYTNQYDCNENDCEWSFDGTCFTPIDEPWMHCWDLDEDECVQSPDCKLETGDFGPGGGEGGPECMSDCPMYPDPSSWTEASECEWLSGMVNTGCLSDCDMELSDMQNMLKMQYHIQCDDTNNDCVGFFDEGNEGGECPYSCGYMYEDFCEFDIPVASDFSTCCPGFNLANCPVEQQAPINQGALDECMLNLGITYGADTTATGGNMYGGLCQGCNISQLAYFYSDTTNNANAISASSVVIDATVSTKPFCDRLSQEVMYGIYGCNYEVEELIYKLESDCSACTTDQCYTGVFGNTGLQTLDCTNATFVTSCSATTNETDCVCDPDCEWKPNAGGASGGTCKDFGSDDFVGADGPACLSGDTSSAGSWDWDSKHPEDDPNGFCNYLVGLPAAATDDCVGPEGVLRCEQHICEECLAIGGGMCDEIFGNDGDGMDMAVTKLSKVPVPNDGILSRGSSCGEGYLEDCSGDGDCCEESWLGDGYADCADQEFGCDLSCYDNDGGDCEASFGESECVPSSPCFKAENQYQSACLDNPACAWIYDEFSMENHCEPKPSFNPNACGTLTQTACGQDDACQWNAQAGPNDPGNFQPHCGPKAPDDCFALGTQSACDASLTCEWEAPDWMPPWQEGVCFTNNPCMTPENGDPDVCDSKPGCEWDWDYYECVEAGSGNDFCDCHVSLTAKICNEIGGKWELPGWAMDCDDCYDIDKECMMPLTQQDCFDQDQYNDPCEEFYQGGNQSTSWENNKCVNENSFSDAGTWGLGDGCLELNWEEQPEPACNDPKLQDEDKCYCFDCEWKDMTGECVEWGGDGMGRKTDQVKMRNLQDMIYQLSGSGSADGECLDYHMMDSGVIHLVEIDDEYGYCQVITLTPTQNQ